LYDCACNINQYDKKSSQVCSFLTGPGSRNSGGYKEYKDYKDKAFRQELQKEKSKFVVVLP
jgi:hypothetical protein